MLFAAYFAIVFRRHLEQFVAAVSDDDAALVAQGLHLCGGGGFEIHSDLQAAEGFFEHAHGKLFVAAVGADFRHDKSLLALPFQRAAETFFAQAATELVASKVR